VQIRSLSGGSTGRLDVINSGDLAMFTAIRRASSHVSNLALRAASRKAIFYCDRRHSFWL
jgi:hypothetical protein